MYKEKFPIKLPRSVVVAVRGVIGCVTHRSRKVDRMRRFLVLQPQSTLLEAAAVTAAIYLCRALLPYFPFSLLALLLQ